MLWRAALPFLKRSKRLAASFDRRVTPGLPGSQVWIQAASAGEAFLALSILRTLSPPALTRVLVTTTTDQGYGILARGVADLPPNPSLEIRLDYFPFDMPAAVARAVTQVAPRAMVLLETEIWPALLHALKERGIPVLVLNGRLSRKSGRNYRLTRGFWKRFAPDRILAISDRDRNLYEQVFAGTRVSVMPNIKFDILNTEDPQERNTALARLFPGPLPLSVLASFRRQEEKQILTLLTELCKRVPEQAVALFPRHMHRVAAVGRKLAALKIPFVLRSELKGPVTAPTVILWDTFGELRNAYALARSVFVGGSLAPLGGQNFIEPAVQGVPTVIGPHWDDFAWVGEEILSLGFVTSVPDARAAARTMAEHLTSLPAADANRQAAEAYIRTRCGGSRAACEAILGVLKPSTRTESAF